MHTARLVSGLLALWLGACGPLEPELPLRDIELGTGTLEVRYTSPLGPAAFGSHGVRFYLRRDGAARLLASTKLANDGAVPGEGNLEVTAVPGGSWLVTLKGQEQADECWRLSTAGERVEMTRL